MDLSPEQLLQFQKFMNDNHEAAEKITETPVLMLQGTLDKLVKPEGTWDLFNELATSKKTFVALPSEHLVLEEGQAKPSKYDANTAELVAGWIYGNLPDPSTSVAKVAADNISPINTSGSGIAHGSKSNSDSGSITGGAPVVLVFEDSWCVECKGLDELFGQAQKIFGTQVTVKTVNVSDPANASLVAKYKIAPIPTSVFLRKDGTVDSVLIGRGDKQNIAMHLRSSAAPAHTQSMTGSSK
jgi:thiol-disulfide isomerase/thioredoxin